MGIGRVAGPLLQSNLDRQGIDLQFSTDGSSLLYLDFANFRAAINSNVDLATETFTINGNALLGNIKLDNTTISSVGNLHLTPSAGSIVAIHSDKALLVPVGPAGARPLSPLAGYFRFNTSINLLEVFDGTSWVGTGTGTITNQILPSDDVTYIFTMSKAAFQNNILVIINGLVQVPGNSYTTLGTTITFAEPPLASETVEIRFLT